MTLQRRLLHAMLALLGFAALAGISTIFLPGSEFIGRVAGTLFFAAIAIAIAMPSSKKLASQSDRTAGLVTLLAIVIAFCLAFISLWADYYMSSFDWHLPVTTIAYIVCAIPALAFLSIFKQPGGRICGLAGITFSAIIFLSWLIAIWFDYFSSANHSESFFKTTGLLTAAAIPICACLFGELSDRKYWRWIGVLTGIAAIFMGMIGIWLITGGRPTNIIYCLIISTVIGGSNILLRLALPAGQRWLALATTCMLIATGLCAMYVNLIVDGDPTSNFDDISLRLLTAGAIVTTCGILALAVLKAFNRRVIVTEAQSIADIKQINLACPRCAKKQDAELGESRCTGCGLIFLLRIAEPHCSKCNYMLLDIRAGRCPECGEPISASGEPQSPLMA